MTTWFTADQHLGHQRALDFPLQEYSFTNVYRVADRVSQDLLRRVIYDGKEATRSVEDTIFRILLYKTFNRPGTWDLFVGSLGEDPSPNNFSVGRYDQILTDALGRKERVFNSAYMQTAAHSWGERRHLFYLKLQQTWLDDNVGEKCTSGDMRHCYDTLIEYPTMGPFLAQQYAIDIGYSPVGGWEEDEYIVPGPGAKRGIAKCFTSVGRLSEPDVIRWMTETQDAWFAETGVSFQKLGGRPLQLIDIQNVLCEFDKYCRVAFPEVVVDKKKAPSRSRIKRRFRPSPTKIEYIFPPKWGIGKIALASGLGGY